MGFGSSKGGQNNQQPVANTPPDDSGQTGNRLILPPMQPSGVPFMPTKEQVLAQPIPQPQMDWRQQILQALPQISEVVKSIPLGLSASDVVKYLVQGGYLSPTSALTLLGQLPVQLHQQTGLLGPTSVEPPGQYNLGIRSPGERSPADQLALLKRIVKQSETGPD